MAGFLPPPGSLRDPSASLCQVRPCPPAAAAAIIPAKLPPDGAVPARPAALRGAAGPRAPLAPPAARALPADPPLLQIALRQGMRADTGALLALCEKTENDIRSCINTLQVLVSPGVSGGFAVVLDLIWPQMGMEGGEKLSQADP